MAGRAPTKNDAIKAGVRQRAKELADNGMPYQMAMAVAQNRITLDDALERLARRAKVERLMRSHELSRALATQVVLGQADLDAFLMKRRMEQHRKANMNRSCLDEAQASGESLVFWLHGQRRVTAKVVSAEAYQVVVHEDGQAEPEEVHKLQFKFAYAASDWKRVRKVLKKDKALTKEPKAPIERPQDRYTCSDKRLFRYVDAGTTVDVLLLEGELLRGQVAWFGRYELGLKIKGDVHITVFRHALERIGEST